MTAVSIGVFPILLFFGGFSLPLGLPPLPEDPMLSRVAPEECLGYVSWAGTATPDSKSTNQTEQLLAEPEVQALLAAIDGAVTKAIARNAGIGGGNAEIAKEIYPLAKTLADTPRGDLSVEDRDQSAGPSQCPGRGDLQSGGKDRFRSHNAREPGEAPAARVCREDRDCRCVVSSDSSWHRCRR